MTCQMMMSLGVYVLGAADAEESRRVQAHLPGCPACRAELALLTPLPGLLARAGENALAAERHPDRPAIQGPDRAAIQGPDRAAIQGPDRAAIQRPDRAAIQRPDRAVIQDPDRAAIQRRDRAAGQGQGHAAARRLDQAAGHRPGRAAAQRPDRPAALVSDRPAALVPDRPAGRSAPVSSPGRSARTWRAAAMAASVAAVAGAAGGFWLAPRAASHQPATVTLSGANPALHVTATAALTATSWGTSIQLRVDGLPLNVPCRLIVRSRTGATEVTGVWDAWRTGPITVPASAGWLPSDIASLRVATTARNLVTISGHPAASPDNRPRQPLPRSGSR
jgi:Putative zinc-finger